MVESYGRRALVLDKLTQHRMLGASLRRTEARLRPQLPTSFGLRPALKGTRVQLQAFIAVPPEVARLQVDVDEASDVYCTSPLVLKDPRVARQVKQNMTYLACQLKLKLSEVAQSWTRQVSALLLEEGLVIKDIFCYEHGIRQVKDVLQRHALQADRALEFKLLLEQRTPLTCPDYEVARVCQLVVTALEQYGEMSAFDIARIARDNSSRCKSWNRWKQMLCWPKSPFLGRLWVNRYAEQSEILPTGRQARKGHPIFRCSRRGRATVDEWMGQFSKP